MICKKLFVTLALLLPVSLFSQEYPGTKSAWEGCDRYDFTVEGRDAIVVVPAKAAPGRPWICRPAFFDAFASVDKALLRAGWHVAYYDVTHLYGSPRAVRLFKAFYDYVAPAFALSPRLVVEGFSRGGYFAFNWAAAYPGTVAALYVDAPVCDINTWPRETDKARWPEFLAEWGVREEEVDASFRGNAVSLLQPIAAAGIPIIAVVGDADKTVPYDRNMLPVEEAYRDLRGIVEVIVKPGCDHHPHSLVDPAPVVEFLMQCFESGK